MHNNFLDKRRRNLRLQPDQVELILPEHFATSYPKFINLLTFYYEFQSDEKATELLHHLFSARDITETDIELLSYIEDELLLGDAYFESFATEDAQKRAIANFSNALFRSKGTRFAIQWFFRSFYGLDAEIVETKNNVFKVGETSSTIGPSSLKFITDDKLYQTFAYLVRSSVPITQWGELFKLFVHPAGMYLGAELLITDDALLSFLTDDSDAQVSTRTSPTWAVTGTTTANEGTDFNLTLTGTNALDGTYRYYIEKLSSSEDDFRYSTDSVFPDSANKREFVLSSGAATITIPTVHDSVETEGTENFRVYFEDTQERILASSLITVNDLVSSYTFTRDPASETINEGQTAVIDITGTNVPNNGTTILEYDILARGASASGTDSADSADIAVSAFSGIPVGGGRQRIAILNSEATLEIPTRVDGQTGENTERFDVIFYTQGGVEKGRTFFDLLNVTPEFTSFGVSITEDSDISVQLLVDSSTIGETVEFTINPTALETRIQTTTGQFTLTGVDDFYTLSATTSTDSTGDLVSTIDLETLPVASGGFFTPVLSESVTLTINSKPLEILSVTAETSGLTRGDSVNFQVTTTNVADGTGDNLKYYIDHVNTDSDDFGFIHPPFTPENEGEGVTLSFTDNFVNIPINFADNGQTTAETFDVVVFSPAGDSARVSYEIIDNTKTYTLTTTSGTTLTETDTVTFDFETNDTPSTDYYYYIEAVSGTITNGDFVDYYTSASRGTFAVDANGDGSFTIETQDTTKVREGTEQFKVTVARSATGGGVVSSAVFTITDTITQTYTLSVSDITEGETLNAVATSNSLNSENVFVTYEVTSGNPLRITDSDTPNEVINSASSLANRTFSASTAATSPINGDRTITATLKLVTGGTVLATDTCTVSDGLTAYTLTTNKTNDSANEGDTIQFNFGGSNVPSGTYYYTLGSDTVKTGGRIITKVLLQQTQNQPYIIFDSSTSDIDGILETGMELRFDSSAPVTIDSSAVINLIFDYDGNPPANNDFVGMTEYVTGTNMLSSAPLTQRIVHFAQPNVFADFSPFLDQTPYGRFSHETGTTSTFSVVSLDSTDVPLDSATISYNMIVTSDPEALTGLISKRFTIYDNDENIQPNAQLGTLTEGSNISGSANVANGDSPAVARIIFRPSGAIDVEFSDGNVVDTASRGDWVDDTGGSFDPSLFKITATIVADNGTQLVPENGSYGTALNLGSTQTFSITTTEPTSSPSIYFATREISFTIQEIGNEVANSVTLNSFTLQVTTSYFDGVDRD